MQNYKYSFLLLCFSIFYISTIVKANVVISKEHPPTFIESVVDSTTEKQKSDTRLGVAVVTANSVKRLSQTAFNAIAIDTRPLRNTTQTLADALVKAPGIKIRETGGVGSDLQVMMDGFTGKHVKVFIDGVPQEGVGSSFSLNNIPAGFAERIEVYKGVVPVEFGTDALGGIINIVTGKQRRGWNLEASYSYGSYDTHRTHALFSQSLKNGFTYEITAFQNYSKNNYKVDVPIEDFETGRIDRNHLQTVSRFHDSYHNEAVAIKAGWVGKPWADRLMFGLTYSHEYKDLQTGVRQETVFGQKHRHGFAWMPSLEWRKRDLLFKGLSASLHLNYNRNQRTNVDTAQVKYNWLGETHPINSPGEQSLQYARANNDNWNATARLSYYFDKKHSVVLNHVFNGFHRKNTSLLAKEEQTDAIGKNTLKNITGLSYRWTPTQKWDLTIFGKLYTLKVEGPMAIDANATFFTQATKNHQNWGYGIAGTYFFPLKGSQAKISYEKAFRLPTIEEMFGDEDLEQGNTGIRPEQSHNINVALSWQTQMNRWHTFYAEGGFVFRDTRDYIQRNITDLSGGKEAATYINYGKVLTKGWNLTLRYHFKDLLNIGGTFTQMDVRDNMKTMIGTSMPNLLYKDRMPNLPFRFADADFSINWKDVLGDKDRLTLTYDLRYTHSFTYYASSIGANKDDYLVPDQWAHNAAITYSWGNSRYHLSLECKNLMNAQLYDNFSLQKPGRSFFAKFRIHLNNQ